MFKVNKDFCLACGRCAITCFRGAISLISGKADIDQSKCNGCGICVETCNRGAIIEHIPVSKDELRQTVYDLKKWVEESLQRIEKLAG